MDPDRQSGKGPAANPGKAWADRWAVLLAAATVVLFVWFFKGEIARLLWRWSSDPAWSHGFLIPFISVYLAYARRDRLRGMVPRPTFMGSIGLSFWVALYLGNLASPSGFVYAGALAMVMALACVILAMGGWGLLAALAVPVLYLVLALPLPQQVLIGLAMPLRVAAARFAATALDLLPGVETFHRGVLIDLAYRGRVLEPALDVAEACSGLRLLMAFVALGVAFAYLHAGPPWHRWLLFVCTVPIAVFCNLVRVTASGLIYIWFGHRYIEGLYHDLLGLAMLPLAVLIYNGLALVISGSASNTAPGAAADTAVAGRGMSLAQWPAGSIRLRLASCVVILACGVACLAAVQGLGRVDLGLRRVSLNRPLDRLDPNSLWPFRLESIQRIQDTDILQALGTSDYIQWVLYDSHSEPADPAARVLLFVTYYGLADRIPHIPDRCYVGAGFRRSDAELLHIEIQGPSGPREIPVRYALFEPAAADMGIPIPVLYLFRVNDSYIADRNLARLALNRALLTGYSYFSKIELVFNQAGGGIHKEQAIRTAARLLGSLLLELERAHWPSVGD